MVLFNLCALVPFCFLASIMYKANFPPEIIRKTMVRFSSDFKKKRT